MNKKRYSTVLATVCLAFLGVAMWSCDEQPTNPEVIQGRHGELFLRSNVWEVTGELCATHFASVDEAKSQARDHVDATKAFVDSLHRHGKEFLFVFVPTKPSVYPEYLPQEYRDRIADFSLEEYYIQLFQERHLPHIDFYHYFRDIKDTVSYPLYTLTGSHWAQHTMPMVADTVFRYLETLTGKPYPTVVRAETLTTQYTVQDQELEVALNPRRPLRKPALPDGHFVLRDTLAPDERPKLLVIGDGNFTPLKNSSFTQAFNEWDFWIYNKYYQASRPHCQWGYLEFFPQRYEILEGADMVMAFVSADYFYHYLFDIEETAYRLWAHGPLSEEELIDMKMNEIKSNPEWYDAIVKQAEERGIGVEENLRNNAIYVLNNTKHE